MRAKKCFVCFVSDTVSDQKGSEQPLQHFGVILKGKRSQIKKLRAAIAQLE